MNLLRSKSRFLSLIFLFCLSFAIISGCKLRAKKLGKGGDAEQRGVQPHVAEGAEINLSTESLRISVPTQGDQYNSIEESSADRVTAFYKVFTFRSNLETKVNFDLQENPQYSSCSNSLPVEAEVRLLSNEGLINLRQQKAAVFHAGVQYSLEVRLANLGKCQYVSYRFSIKAAPGTVAPQPSAPTPPVSPRLSAPVACDWIDEAGYYGKMSYDPALNKIMIQNGPNTVPVELFGEKTACGFKPSNNAVKCDLSAQFNGEVYSKPLNCSYVAPSVETPVSSGNFNFSLRSGLGSLNCSVYSAVRASLTLRNCKLTAVGTDGLE